jgi:hypothetical protein
MSVKYVESRTAVKSVGCGEDERDPMMDYSRMADPAELSLHARNRQTIASPVGKHFATYED